VKAELEGNVSAVISGLGLDNSNYEVAIILLKERFGREELLINANYSALMELSVSSNDHLN